MKTKQPTEVSSDYNKLSNPTNTITINADTTTTSKARLRKSRVQRI